MTSAQGQGVTAALAKFAANVRFEDLPPAVVQDTKRIIADTVACAAGGNVLPAGRLITETARQLGRGLHEATIFGSSDKVAAPAAAFANAALANALDADETFFNSSHHACVTVPAAFAQAEALGLSGRQLILSVAVGYEIAARVALSLTIARVNERGDIERFPQTGLAWVVFAGAAAASKAAGLNASQFAQALGIAAWTSPISIHLKWDHSGELHMMKNAPHGFMAFNGVMAARMAGLGLTAERAIFDGDDGYWRLIGSPESNWPSLTEKLGETWWISKAAIKPYATNRLVQHAISLFENIVRSSQLAPEDIERVEIRSFARVASKFLSGNLEPKNPVEAQFSLPFALAAIAHGHQLGPQWCSDANIKDPKLRAFARKIVVTTDPDIQREMAEDLKATRRYPRVPTKIAVIANGQRFTAETDHAPGDPDTPETRMSDAALERKFHLFTDDVYGSERSDVLWRRLMSIEDWASGDDFWR